MNYWTQVAPAQDFTVLATTERSQSATMVLPPETRWGGPDNVHPHADQWLYVLAGNGQAAVASQALELGPGTVVLIEAGESLELHNLGETPLETFNIYAPPVY